MLLMEKSADLGQQLVIHRIATEPWLPAYPALLIFSPVLEICPPLDPWVTLLEVLKLLTQLRIATERA